MKRPVAIVVGATMHFALSVLGVLALIFIVKKLTPANIVFFSSCVIFNIFGLIAILTRAAWSPRFSLWVFAIYMFLNLGQLSRALKSNPSIINLLLSLCVAGILVWLVIKFGTDRTVKSYFVKSPEIPTTAQI
jgi:hypothetical protein